MQYFGISSVRKLSCVKFLDFQILDWLSHSPTDIESYIRPGCIVLTIYLRLPESTWEEVSFFLLKTQKYVITVLFPGNTTYIPCFDCFIQLCCDLGSSLSRLLDVSNDTFWRTGWVYIRVQHQIAFIYNGLFPPPPFFPLDFFFFFFYFITLMPSNVDTSQHFWMEDGEFLPSFSVLQVRLL